MTLKISPPPTFADVSITNPASGKPAFNPIWLKWFYDVAQILSAPPATGTAVLAAAVEAPASQATAAISTTTDWIDGSGTSEATLSNAPKVGNPTKWIPIDDNGVTRYIPTW